jgi:hypothetical protein
MVLFAHFRSAHTEGAYTEGAYTEGAYTEALRRRSTAPPFPDRRVTTS